MSEVLQQAAPARHIHRHALTLRIAHWVMALSILILIGSGWRIYNASPLFPFTFPLAITIGGDEQVALEWHNDPGVATAIAWHFAAIWLLFGSFLLFLGYGALSGHFWRDLLPVYPRDFVRDFRDAARFRLAHRLGTYNAVQRAFYWGVILATTMMILSGLAIWKPIQLYPLVVFFGGFQGARLIHFLFMAAMVAFLIVHMALVILVPRTFLAMTLGRVSERE